MLAHIFSDSVLGTLGAWAVGLGGAAAIYGTFIWLSRKVLRWAFKL